jgi:hypothetical protein
VTTAEDAVRLKDHVLVVYAPGDRLSSDSFYAVALAGKYITVRILSRDAIAL